MNWCKEFSFCVCHKDGQQDFGIVVAMSEHIARECVRAFFTEITFISVMEVECDHT